MIPGEQALPSQGNMTKSTTASPSTAKPKKTPKTQPPRNRQPSMPVLEGDKHLHNRQGMRLRSYERHLPPNERCDDRDSSTFQKPPRATFSDAHTASANEWSDEDWNQDSSSVAAPPPAPRAARQKLTRRYIDDMFQLVLQHIHDLEHKVESTTHCVLSHHHDSDDQRKKAENAARKRQDSISRHVTNGIEMQIEDNSAAVEHSEAEAKVHSRIERKLRLLVDEVTESKESLEEKLDAQSKVQEMINQRVGNMIDLIIDIFDDLPDVLSERGLVCRCGGSSQGESTLVPGTPRLSPVRDRSLGREPSVAELDRRLPELERGLADLVMHHRMNLPGRSGPARETRGRGAEASDGEFGRSFGWAAGRGDGRQGQSAPGGKGRRVGDD